MTEFVDLLNGGIVAVLVRYEESGLDVASVGVLAAAVEDIPVEFNVVVVDGVVEGDHDHLGHGLDVHVVGDGRPVFRAETVGQKTRFRFAWRSSVGIRFQICTTPTIQYNQSIYLSINRVIDRQLPQEFSSEPSVQSGMPLQKLSLSMHVPS